MTEDAPAPRTVQDLRARRRWDTRQEIHQAALELFERHGVRNTTVQQIAEHAGVSPRTFFRYFASKEQAGLPGQHRLLEAVDSLDLTDADPATALRRVEEAAERVMSTENDPGLHEHRRLARLLAHEPELQALAATQEQELTTRLRARIADQLRDHDQTTALLIADVAVALWRTCWVRWGELALNEDTADDHATDPARLYRHCRDLLRTIVG